jgi:hypothetical protein
MLTGGTDPIYRAALGAPHQVYLRVDVTDYNGVVLLSDLPVTSGQIRATLSSRNTRSLTFGTYRAYYPLTASGAANSSAALWPFGNRVKVYRGVQYGDGQYDAWPIFYGRIDEPLLNRDGSVTVTCSDLTQEVVEAQFEQPTPSVTGAYVTDEIKRLISAGLTNATYGTFDTDGHVAPSVIWTTDRGKALDDLASGAGGIWYTLASGDFVYRKLPWTLSGRTPVATISDGPGGILLDYQLGISRTGANNSVVAVSERVDGSAPLTYVSRDLDPSSRTYYLGPFGRKPITVQLQTPLNLSQLKAVADTRLAQSKATTITFKQMKIVPDASLELGDLIQVYTESANDIFEGYAAQQVIVGYTMPLLENQSMTLDLRSYVPVT